MKLMEYIDNVLLEGSMSHFSHLSLCSFFKKKKVNNSDKNIIPKFLHNIKT